MNDVFIDFTNDFEHSKRQAKEAQMGFRDDRAFPEYPDVACKAYLDYLDKKVSALVLLTLTLRHFLCLRVLADKNNKQFSN